MIFSKLQSELVVSSHIFQFLGWNDLLRLRRVSKDAKILAEDYLRLHGTLKRFVVINDENISEFLSLAPTLPISRFRLYNKEISFFESEQLQTLVDLYGDKITHLNVKYLEIPMDHCPKVVAFFDSLPNLCYLETNLQLFQPGHQCRPLDDKDTSPSAMPIRELLLPSAFKRLRHLKLRDYQCNTDYDSVQLVQYLWRFLEECSVHLETIHLTPLPWFADSREGAIVVAVPGGEFGCVKRIVERRHEENPNEPNLREIDFQGFFEDDNYPRATSFYELVSTCSQHNVKFLNVNANFIEGMMRLETPDRADHGRKISNVLASLWGIHSSSFLLELPHLTEIRINNEDTGTSRLCSMPPGRIERQAWSNLKKVDILVDAESVENVDGDVVDASELLDFFFKGIRRENLETLRLSFNVNEADLEDDEDEISISIPRMRAVCSSCPNLKILKIGNWLGTNKAISKLWGNLPLLEKLTFKNCGGLGNVAFVGEDKANPGILKMKRLRTLKFSGLEEMPKITDHLFTLVLRRMPLRELHLKSNVKNTPLTSITVAGISSLLVGEFAKSIEKLKLNISLEDVTDEELTDLGKLFRSSKML